jgi:putative transposase
VKPAQQRERVGYLRAAYGISTRRACLLVRFNRATQYFTPRLAAKNAALAERIKAIAAARVRYGYRRIHVLLRREGVRVNHKRVRRLYALEGLNLRSKMPHRRRASVARSERVVAQRSNQIWAMDFMHDRLADNRKVRLLTIVDLFSRECVALEVRHSWTSHDLVRVLERNCRTRGVPEMIRCDNGPEFVAEPLDQWAFWNGVKLDFSRPGKPVDNAFCESFNGRVRAEFLNPSYFETLVQVKRAAGIWRHYYNEIRPHSMLGNRTPSEAAAAAFQTLSS